MLHEEAIHILPNNHYVLSRYFKSINSENIVNSLQKYDSMINTWDLDNVPVFDGTSVTYPENNSKLTFPARNRNQFAPAELIKKNSNVVRNVPT